MMAQEKHWFNPNLLAPNVMEIDVDPCVFAPASALAREVQAITGCSHQARLGSGLALHVHSMATEWDSDMLWISHSDVESFTFFENLFRASRIAELVTHHIDYKDTIQLYSGFFVSRGRCTKPNFHFDWIDANNNAFTFLMPLTSNCQDMGLTYITVRGDQAEYRYRPNKALLFGDFFIIQPPLERLPNGASFSVSPLAQTRWSTGRPSPRQPQRRAGFIGAQTGTMSAMENSCCKADLDARKRGAIQAVSL